MSALIVPNFPNLRKWAEAEGIHDGDTAALVDDPRVEAFIMRQVDGVQKHLAEFEKIKRIKLLPQHFSIMNGEVTNTMKVRRPVVAKRYAREIDSLYPPEFS